MPYFISQTHKFNHARLHGPDEEAAYGPEKAHPLHSCDGNHGSWKEYIHIHSHWKPGYSHWNSVGLDWRFANVFILVLSPKLTLPPVTQEVQDYILDYVLNGDLYEIHLTDSPGFDDGGVLSDTDVLSKIATYVNTSFRLKQKIAGVLYLHDITKGKLGGAAVNNIRLLENMIGIEEYKNCTFITTKWGCTTNPQDEQKREEALAKDKRFFGGMLQSPRHATMKRFDPKTKATALEIITPFLEIKFTLRITREMADPEGPKLALGETKAGILVTNGVEKLAQAKQDMAKVQRAQEILAQKYDEDLFEEFNQKRKKLRRKINLQRSGRWIIRTTIVGGAIVATVITLGPGASTFALEPMYEKAVRSQRRAEKKAKEDLKEDFVRKSKGGGRLKEINPDWLDDTHVKQMKDLESYSLKSGSSDANISKIVQQGTTVGFAASEGSEAPLDVADLEDSEFSDSDTEMSTSDYEVV